MQRLEARDRSREWPAETGLTTQKRLREQTHTGLGFGAYTLGGALTANINRIVGVEGEVR
jgi:hypothetical protein